MERETSRNPPKPSNPLQVSFDPIVEKSAASGSADPYGDLGGELNVKMSSMCLYSCLFILSFKKSRLGFSSSCYSFFSSYLALLQKDDSGQK